MLLASKYTKEREKKANGATCHLSKFDDASNIVFSVIVFLCPCKQFVTMLKKVQISKMLAKC